MRLIRNAGVRGLTLAGLSKTIRQVPGAPLFSSFSIRQALYRLKKDHRLRLADGFRDVVFVAPEFEKSWTFLTPSHPQQSKVFSKSPALQPRTPGLSPALKPSTPSLRPATPGQSPRLNPSPALGSKGKGGYLPIPPMEDIRGLLGEGLHPPGATPGGQPLIDLRRQPFRPWTLLSGHPHKALLDLYEQNLCSYICSHPGVRLSTLSERFHSLTPCELKRLLVQLHRQGRLSLVPAISSSATTSSAAAATTTSVSDERKGRRKVSLWSDTPMDPQASSLISPVSDESEGVEEIIYVFPSTDGLLCVG